MAEFRRVVPVIAMIGLLAAPPAAAQEAVSFDPVFVEPATYLTLFDDADLRGVVQPDDEVYDLFVDITGDATLDQRIREAAEARGYLRRPVPAVELVTVDGRRLQAAAAEAWTAMKAAARADGISLVLTSAYRDLDAQTALFRGRLGGSTSDAGIEQALRTSAPPGYSKHHSGYAIDVGQAGATDGGFANTQAYRWLSDADFFRARLFGFVPSYPVDGEDMGPDPEAWEFVWVGAGRIACATGGERAAGFCDLGATSRLADIEWMADLGVTVGCAPDRFCPDDPITRGEAASLLWRLYGAPAPTSSAPFVDVYAGDHFGPAVDWLWGIGVVAGTSPDTFSPDEFLRPAQALTLVLRLSTLEDLPAPEGMLGHDADPAAAITPELGTVGDLGDLIDRAEFASLLHAVARAA